MLSQLEQTSYYLKHIVLEDGIEELEFQGCPNLETVVFPPSIKKIDTRHFKNLKKQITIYVTKDSYAGKMGKKTSFYLSLWDNGKGVEMILKNWIDFIRKHTSIFIILLVSQILALLCIFFVFGVFQNNLYEINDYDDTRSLNASI